MRQHHAQILFRYIVLQVLVGINIGEVFRDKSSKWGMGGGGGGSKGGMGRVPLIDCSQGFQGPAHSSQFLIFLCFVMVVLRVRCFKVYISGAFFHKKAHQWSKYSIYHQN